MSRQRATRCALGLAGDFASDHGALGRPPTLWRAPSAPKEGGQWIAARGIGAGDLVRAAVINAIGYRGWPESRGFLEEVAKEDASASLRENARKIVDAWWGEAAGSATEE